MPVICLEGTVHTTGFAGGFDYAAGHPGKQPWLSLICTVPGMPAPGTGKRKNRAQIHAF